jgi:hypothetical protein
MPTLSFDARVREDRRIGFFCPASITPGSNCQFTVTITSLTTPATLWAMFTFTAIVPADRKIIFVCPGTVPFGMQHFTVQIVVLAAGPAGAAMMAGASPAASAQEDVVDADDDLEIATPQEQSSE